MTATVVGEPSREVEYPRGETVTASPDPDEPDEAFLEIERSWGPYLFAVIGAVVTPVGFDCLTKVRIAERRREGV